LVTAMWIGPKRVAAGSFMPLNLVRRRSRA